MNKNSFYDEIMKEDQYFQEKQASTGTDAEYDSMLDAFSTDELEALASELHLVYEKKGSLSSTIEEKIAEDTQVQREEAKEDLAQQNADKTSDAGEEEETDEREDATESEEAEEAKTLAEKEEIVNPEAKENETVVTAAEYDEAELTKIAYEVAEEKLAEAGYTVLDYVFTKIPNEKIAGFVAENAEKLAYLSQKSPLQVADDILLNMGAIVGEMGE